INRFHADPMRFGDSVKDCCLEHDQFSCWNANSGSNHDWLLGQVKALLTGAYVAPIIVQCISAAQKLLDGALPDSVAGATSYYSPKSMVPEGRIPVWARGKMPVATIGGQLFFRV